jgi:hypothetical protein
MDLKELGWEDVDWIYLAQVRVKWRADQHGNAPSGFVGGGKFLE